MVPGNPDEPGFPEIEPGPGALPTRFCGLVEPGTRNRFPGKSGNFQSGPGRSGERGCLSEPP